MLGPLPEADDILHYLIAAGQATAPAGDLPHLPPPRPAQGPPSTDILDELRGDRVERRLPPRLRPPRARHRRG